MVSYPHLNMTLQAPFCPHTFPWTQSSITYDAQRRSAGIQQNSTAIFLFLNLRLQLMVNEHDNTAERERFVVAIAISSRRIVELNRRLQLRERQLRTVTRNLNHALICLSA